MRKLHAREAIVSRIATKVVSNGVPRFLKWSFEKERAEVIAYVRSREVGAFAYTFAASTSHPVLYGSVYAFMLHSMLDAFDSPRTIAAWIDTFDGYQSEDGLFRDAVLAGPAFEGNGIWGEGWGARHLTAHMIIPYARAGRRPRRSFRFLEPYYDIPTLDAWLADFDLAEGVWSQSNYIMNLYTLMQFIRDHMGERRAAPAIARIGQMLLARQNPATGMWHGKPLATRAALNDAIRGAYHFYPLFEYEGVAIPHQEKVIDHILTSQNSWGAFDEEDRPAGACEDFDALDPLLRFTRRTGYRASEVRVAAQRALVWILACRNADGGSVSLLENGCHYGDHPETTSLPGESNMFATWFRTLTTAHVTSYLGMPQRYAIGRYPGYEISLPRAMKVA
jgi:hypothetical protein